MKYYLNEHIYIGKEKDNKFLTYNNNDDSLEGIRLEIMRGRERTKSQCVEKSE